MSQTETIEIDVLLELKDVVRASYTSLLHGTRNLILVATFALMFILLPVIWFFLQWGELVSSADGPTWWPLLGLIAGPAIMALIYVMARRGFHTNKALQEPIHYTLTEAGLEAIAPSSSGRTSWENFRKAYETKHDFLLFISDRMMYMIPKRSLTRGEDIEGFRELLRSRLKGKARMRK
jgi:hypothetical protein